MKRIATRLSDADITAVAAWLAQQDAAAPILRPSRRTSCACRSPAAASVDDERRSRFASFSGLAVVAAVAATALYLLRPGMLPRTPGGARPSNATTQIINRGEYLARAGDCVACHTEAERQAVRRRPRDADAVRQPVSFPTSRPTTRPASASGRADDFYRMMHTGVSRDGTLLYPAMPFASYTKVTRADSDAIYAYLMSVPPVKQKNRPHELQFPFNNRDLLLGWRTLYFKEGEYVPDPKQSAQWNRGAYLVEGLGHCAMCHTAINALGGSSESKEFEGGMIPNQNWYAPVAHVQPRSGPRQLGDQGHRRPAAGRRLAPRPRSTARWPRWSTTACST